MTFSTLSTIDPMSRTDSNHNQSLNTAYPSAEDMMTDSLAIEDLKLFGYADTEARFLGLVALHSGVFLARQFNQFARAKTGYRVDAFIRKLKSNRHCHTYRLGKNAAMFHCTRKRSIERSVMKTCVIVALIRSATSRPSSSH